MSQYTYTCPACEKMHDRIVEWNDASVGYMLVLRTKSYMLHDIIPDEKKSDYTCPKCGEDLPEELTKTLSL